MVTQQQELMQRLVELTEAVKEIAARAGHPATEIPHQRPVVIDVDADEPAPLTDAERVRQRVAFSYQALGTLTGRVSTASGREFDIPVVRATRGDNTIFFEDLPSGAHWVELRSGAKVESLRIRRPPREDAEGHHARSDIGEVLPHLFGASEPIGSMVFLRAARGPLIAFGPRLPAFGSAESVEAPEPAFT